ncbi:uncharacterized protein [Elaeis guineensis]|uniref:FHA domain-containing protein PS1 n=1 Tax=Elaeis guineensis var. tenera TaxID=51953 RepID=A0A6I9QSD8_ELAGV|nr:FHA domain-containing protein PS1 [Elaeis guineensis]
MADEREKPEEKEIKIPVFSVLKKGIVLKNIILNIPPPEPIPSTKSHENGDISNREAEPVLFGRHPDCHIVLDHPSISRFHLEARAIPFLQKLSVTDRSSVHGTWVSGTQIPPNVPIELVEGDTVRLGASTREYRLEWVPLSRAFEMEKPLSPLLEEKEETHQEDKPGQLITDLNEQWDTVIPSAPPMPDSMNPSPSDVPFSLPVKGEEQSPERKGSMEENSSSFFSATLLQESVGSSFPREEEIGYPERRHPSPVRSEKRASSLLSRRSKSKTVSFLRIHTGRSRENISNMSFDAEVEVGVEKENGALCEKDKQEETMCRALPVNLGGKEEEKEEEEEEETFGSDKENVTPMGSISRKSKSRCPDLRRSSSMVTTYLNMEEDAFRSDMENWRPEVLRDLKLNEPTYENVVKNERDDEMYGSDKENLTPGISSGQKIKENSCKLLQRSPFNTITASNVVDSDKENRTPEISREMKSKKPNFGCRMKIEDEEDEAFPSDKENWTPQISLSAKAKEISSKSSAQIEREMMRKGADRMPLQTLFENPSSRKSSFVDDAQRNASDGNCTSINHTQGIGDELNCCFIQAMDKDREGKKIWNMVVDTSCLLDDESRRSLQLLEGLKGTHLIIPRIVIRELDSLKRRESLFRKSTKASSVLQWIEDCMVQTSWWIHVQNSMEIMPVAPTPPASPQSLIIGNGSSNFGADASSCMAFSAWGSLMEIVSPTAEDHILDCAMMFKKIIVGQLVLLSNSVTLKIKAMAEGFICESPKEFRESLVNPFSKRFLWVDSSPRGSTWSCSDETGLVDNYHYQRPSVRKAVKAAEAVKGLKLILLHNSHYGQTNSVK